MNVLFEDLGITAYEKAWEYQKTCHEEIVRAKIGDVDSNVIVFFFVSIRMCIHLEKADRKAICLSTPTS